MHAFNFHHTITHVIFHFKLAYAFTQLRLMSSFCTYPDNFLQQHDLCSYTIFPNFCWCLSARFRTTFSNLLVFSPSFASVFQRAVPYGDTYRLRSFLLFESPQSVPLDTFPCPQSFCCLHVVLFSLSFLFVT